MPDAPEDDDYESKLDMLKRLNRQIDEIIDGGKSAPSVEQLKARLDASEATTLIIQLDRLRGILAASAKSSVAATVENLRLQRQMWWLAIGALVLAVVASIFSAGQLCYAHRADYRATHTAQSPPMPASQAK